MPNWVKNIIEVSGSEEDISNMMQRIRSDDYPFDFNKLIPMPDALSVTAGGIRDYAILYYISDGLKSSINTIKEHRFSSVAWSLPEPIIRKLVSEYPQLSFNGLWADEDLGSNCGRWHSSHGSPVFMDENNLRFACEVWGYDYDEIRAEYDWEDEDEEEEPAPVEVEAEDVSDIEDVPCSIDELIEASHSVLNEHVS